MALNFYVTGKSWQEKMLDRERYQQMGANIGTGLAEGGKALWDIVSPVSRAYKNYLTGKENRMSNLNSIIDKFKSAVEMGDEMDDVGDFKIDDVNKWSDTSLRKTALDWAKNYDKDAFAGLNLEDGLDYEYDKKDFESLKRKDYKKSDLYKESDVYKRLVDPNRLKKDPAIGGSAQAQLNQSHVIAQQKATTPQGNKPTPFKNLFGLISSPFKTDEIDITESGTHGTGLYNVSNNYILPSTYNATARKNLAMGTVDDYQDIEGAAHLMKTPKFGGILQRIFPGGKKGYYVGDLIDPVAAAQQAQQALQTINLSGPKNI